MAKRCVRQERTRHGGAQRRISSAWRWGEVEGDSIRFLFALSSLDGLFVFVKFEIRRALGQYFEPSCEECVSGTGPTTGSITDLSFGANYKAAYGLSVCPAGEEVIAPFLTDRKEFLEDVVKLLQDKVETIYVVRARGDAGLLACADVRTFSDSDVSLWPMWM
jgi:hypothetical protein